MGADWVGAPAKTKARRLSASNPGEVLDSGNGLSADRCRRGWAGVVAEFYLEFLEALEARLKSGMFKCPVYAFGYDWRQSNEVSANALEQRIDEILDHEKASTAVLVTHSMGGIVARAAMLDGAFREKKIAGAIHIGQPVYGAPSAYRGLVEGIKKKFDGNLARLLRDKEESVAVMSVMPSVFELLPSDARLETGNRVHEHWVRYRSRDDAGPLKKLPSELEVVHLYMVATSPPGLVDKSDPQLEKEHPGVTRRIRGGTSRALKFTSPLGAQKHDFTAAIYGEGVETDELGVFTLAEIDPLTNKGGLHGASYDVLAGRSDEGDGTVPSWSAQALFPGQSHDASGPIEPEIQSQWVVRGVTHDVMCNASEVQDAAIEFIHALLLPPKLANSDVGSDGSILHSKLVDARAGDRSAEMEIRVAKLLAQNGEHVTMLVDDGVGPTADMRTNLSDVEVKYSEGGTLVRLRNSIRKGLTQIGSDGRLFVVRATHSSEPIDEKVYREVLEEEFENAFGSDFRKTVRAFHVLVLEEDLPPLWAPVP